MKKDFIDEKINEHVDIEFSFDEIANRIEYPQVQHKKKNKLIFGSLTGFLGAASVAMITFAIVSNIQISSSHGTSSSNTANSETSQVGTSGISSIEINVSSSESDVQIIPWDKRNIIEKYPTFAIENTTYTVSSNIKGVSDIYVGSFIQTIEVQGYDIIENKTYKTSASVYKINNIELNSACAVKFDNVKEYFTYINKEYYFTNIEDVIVATNMLEYTSFSDFYYIEKQDINSKTIIDYDNFDDSVVYDMLLKDYTIANYVPQHNSEPVTFPTCLGAVHLYNSVLNIDDYLILYNNGFIAFNLYGTTSAFYVGEDKINSFIEYAKVNLKYDRIFVQYV